MYKGKMKRTIQKVVFVQMLFKNAFKAGKYTAKLKMSHDDFVTDSHLYKTLVEIQTM